MNRKGRFLTLVSLLALVFSISGCLVVENTYSGLPPGVWRAALKIELNPITTNPKGAPLADKVNIQFDEVAAGELPFTFEVVYPTPDSFYIEIINAGERIIVDDISIGRDRRTAKDTVVINFPVFDSYIRGIFVENILEGEWVVRNKVNYRIPFVAYHGRNHRFTHLKKEPVIDLNGKWEVTFGVDDEHDPYPAIGEFKQDGNLVTGTFLTETGDYRFLEGTIQEDRLYLSTFDGSHAFLFEAKVQADGSLLGSFRSGKHYRTLWSARKNPEAQIRGPNDITYLKNEDEPFQISFPNREGKMISLDDERYQNKVKIVQIFGTWCPNCRDETKFLVDYLKSNPNQEVEVIAVAFERHLEETKAWGSLDRYKEKFGMEYEILLAAASDSKANASELLPMLNEIVSFPTLVFLDRNNRVKRVHTGFNGPATSEYKAFEEDFHKFVQELVNTDQSL